MITYIHEGRRKPNTIQINNKGYLPELLNNKIYHGYILTKSKEDHYNVSILSLVKLRARYLYSKLLYILKFVFHYIKILFKVNESIMFLMRLNLMERHSVVHTISEHMILNIFSFYADFGIMK